MKSRPQSHLMILIALFSLILASLACTFNFDNNSGEDLSIQQTLVALQLTQTALEDKLSVETIPPEDVIQPGVPTDEEPTQESPEVTPDVSYEGISFSFNSNITGGVIPTTIQGQNLGEEVMPSETYPTHYTFNFDAYAVSDHFHTPIILVYPVEEYRAISPYAGDVIDNLKQTLINHPGAGSMSDLPFLPMWNAAQIFSAKVEYFDFQTGSGLRYLTMFGQALYPVDNQNLFYTYQGITHDGRYYICAVLPVSNVGLPDEGQITDWIAFEENWNTYIADTLAWLEAQDVENFNPPLSSLDAMMESFEINR